MNDDNFNKDFQFIDSGLFTDECTNETIDNESFYKRFGRLHNVYPPFFIGSLQDACQVAFSSKIIEQRRPILIYIHNDKSIHNDIFCNEIFCSSANIDYLSKNYILWAHDATFESNMEALKNIWKVMFSSEFYDDFSVEQCPILIGIMRFLFENKNDKFISEYQFKTLFKADTLTQTQEKFSSEILMNKLIIFKKECDDNEQALSLDFINKTGLCWDVILKIIEYLSLNDIINTFSTNILPLLYKYNTKLYISEPSYSFIRMILRKINLEQIVSLELNMNQISDKKDLYSIPMLSKITRLTLVNFEHINEIDPYKIFFPTLNCLSLWYDYEADFSILNGIFPYLSTSIKRFEIHCRKIIYTGNYMIYLKPKRIQNTTIRYFLLDISQYPSFSIENYSHQEDSYFLIIIFRFIKDLINIEYIRLMINKYNIDTILNVNDWKNLVCECHQLKKVTLQIQRTILEDEQLFENVIQIEKELHKIRQTIKFQIIFT